MAIALLLITVELSSGCGGGTVLSYLGSPYKLPPEVISIDALPPHVKALAEKETAGCKIEEVTKGVRSTDGKYYYTIINSDQTGIRKKIRCLHAGTLIS